MVGFAAWVAAGLSESWLAPGARNGVGCAMKQVTVPWKIDWHEGLEIGLSEVDSEHQHFAGIVNELNRAIRNRRGQAELQRLVEALILDAQEHFEHEETLFAEVGYPRAQEHAQEHTRLLNELVELSSQMRFTPFHNLWLEYGLTVKQLLVDHLLSEDMLYRDHMQQQG